MMTHTFLLVGTVSLFLEDPTKVSVVVMVDVVCCDLGCVGVYRWWCCGCDNYRDGVVRIFICG